MEEERFFPLPERDTFRMLHKSLMLDLKICLMCPAELSPPLRSCFPRFMSFIPLFLCCFLTARSVTLSGHTKSWAEFGNLGHPTLGAPCGVRGQLRLSMVLGWSPGHRSWDIPVAPTQWTQCWACKTLRVMKLLQKLWQDRRKNQRWRIVWRAASAAAVWCHSVIWGLCGVTQQLEPPGSVSWSHRGHVAPS